MVGIFTGLGAGFERGSGASLGGVGLLGGAGFGRNNEGVFVNAATGNLLVTQRDEFLVGRGPDAEIARTYNSFGALDENGDHWRQSTDRRVFALTGTVNTAGSTVKRVSADGSEITYSWTGSYYQTTDGGGSHDRLTYSANVWTWQDGDSQWTETYSAYGTNTWRITGQSDNSGNTLAFTYTGDQLTRVMTADGGYIQYSWSGSNITMMVTGYTNLATSTSQTLTRTRYGYDGQGRLETVTVDLTPENNSVADANVYTTTYTYHGTSNRIATISQTDGSSLAIAYDGSGRVTSLTQTVASGDTRVTGFEYLAGETRVTDPRGQVTRLFYDSRNQLIGVEAPVPQTGGTASTVAFSYDAAGNLASMTDAAGAVTQYRYDAQGNVTYVRHPNGSTTLRVYDLANKLIQEIQTGAAITLPAGVGNQAPQAATNAITVTQQQGGGISLDVAALFSDPGDTLTYTVSGLPAGVSFNGQMITGTPSATGTYTITATASDGSLSATKTFTLSVVAVTNQAPVAVNDVVTVPSGTASSINVLFNDHDAENDALTIQIQGQPAHGAVSVSGGQVIYTPAAGYLGADSFTYRVQDANGGYSSVATVSLTVAAGGTPVVTAPTFVGVSTAVDSQTISIPSGTQNGDLMVAVFGGYGSATGTVTLPPGWTALGPVGRSSGNDTTFSQMAWRIASSEPSTYSFALSAGVFPVGSILTYRGATGVGPSVSVQGGDSAVRSNSGITTSQDNSRVVLFSLGYEASVSTPPSGMTARTNWDDASYVWDQLVATAGATGTRSSTHTSHGGSAALLHVSHMVEILGTSSGGGGASLNHAPRGAADVGAVSQAAGGSLSLDLADLFQDADNDALVYSVTNIPAGMSLSGSVLSGAPTTQGSYTLTVTASDGEYSAQVTFTIQVTAPVSGGSIAPVNWNLGSFFDNPAGTITYGASGYPSGLGVSGGVLSGTPATTGTWPVTVTAGRSVTMTVSAVPVGPPAPPTVPSGLPVTNGTSGDDWMYAGTGTGYYNGGAGWNTLEVSGSLSDYYFYAHSATEGLIVHKTTGQILVATNFGAVYFDGSDEWMPQYYLFGVREGTSGADRIVGTDANELIEGGGGNDEIYSGLGNDHIDGGAGWDRLNLLGEKADYTFLRHPDGKLSVVHNPTGKHDVVWNIEQFAFLSGPWSDQVSDLTITDVTYAAPALVPNGGTINPVSWDIAGFFGNPSDPSIVYTVTGLPSGLSVSGGMISGTPAAAGNYTFSITATRVVSLVTTGSAASPVTGFSNVVFASGGGGAPGTVSFNTGAMTFAAPVAGGVTVSAAHITAGLGDSTAVHMRHVYDAAGRLRYSVSGAGNVTEFRYNAAGQLVREVRYPAQAYSASAVATLAQMDAWRDGLADRSGVQIVEYEYDARGGLAQKVSWGAANTNGTASTANGYARTYYAYDQAGNLVSRRTEPDGYVETFVYDGLGRMTGSTDLNGGTTSILFTDAATTTRITTGTGHVITSVYNKAGDLISQTDSGSDAASAAQVSYLYDRNGQVRRTAVRTGRTGDERTDYTYHLYDKSGRKVADIGHGGEVTEYRYDSAGRVVATVRYLNVLTSAQITSLSDPAIELELAAIRPTAHSFDLWQWTTYNASGQVATTVLGDGSVTRYTYDQAGRLIATYGYQNKIAVSGYMNGTSLGPAAATLPAAHAGDTVTRTFYDADGRVRGVLNAEGHLSRIVYDSAGQKVEETVYAGATTAGLRASGTYQQLWDSVSKDAAKDITSRYVYDGQGLLRFAIDALGRVTETIYTVSNPWDANGAVRAVVQFAGTLGALGSYDFAAVNTAVNALRADTNNRGVFNVYNDRGQVAYTIDSAGTVTGFTYDAGGRVTKTVQYAELRSTPSVPTRATMDTWAAANAANARVTRTWYSARGEVVAVVDAEGYVTRNWYDAQGRLWDSRRYATAVTATDAWTLSHIDGASLGTNTLTQYRYDSRGRLSDIHAPDGTRSTIIYYENGQEGWSIEAHTQGRDEARTLLIYDQAGRVTEKRRYTAETFTGWDAAHVRELYTYDGLGNLATVTDANNTVTAYTYDRIGRVLTETRASGTAEAVTTAYEYDAFDQVVRVTDARGHSSYSYYDQAGRTVRTVDAENYLTVTQYTVFGEVHSVTRHYTRISGTPAVGTLPAQPAAHDLDATTSFTYDRLGRVLRATDATRTHYDEYTYTAFGNLETHRNKLGGITSFQYDRLGRRTYETQYVRDVATNALIATIVTRLDYDSRGNITTRTEAYSSADARITNYEYNAVNQLIRSYTPNLSYYADGNAAAATVANMSPGSVTVAEVYSYDRRGNLIEKTDANGVRTQTWYDKLGRVTHQLVQQNATQGTLTRNFYDANGNVTEARVYETLVTLPADATGIAPAGSGNYRVTTFIYDRLNRMTSSTVPNIKYGQYATAFAMSTGSLTTSYLYDAMGNVIRVTDPNGGQVHSYYDKLGRKEREVDQGRYLTYWTYNAQGNVETERRYAQPVTGTVSTASYGTVVPNDPSADAATALAQSYQDRITGYTYDRMGRKLTEARQGVLVFNGTTGFAVQDAVVSFTYNALGQVATKTEAVDAGGAATNAYTYDSAGRLTTEARKAFTDFNNATVTPTVAYAYNLRNDLITQTESGTVGADTRTTVYTYASGGRLESVTDAEGFVRTYRYDRGGNIVREEYTRVLGTGGEAQEGSVYAYDAQGRVVTQYIADRGNGTYAAAANDIRNQTTYNAFGDVASRGVNGVYAEHFRYDNAGRLEATSAGDGIWKYFLYDRNGNQTLAITSTGANIQVLGRDTVLDMFGSEAGIAANHVAGVTATITVYDARGLAIKVLEPQRELAAGAARVTLNTSRSYNAFGEVISETNAREHTVDYTHNTMGRLIRTESPQVNVTGENGVTSAQRPTEYYYYDRSGRMVASRDANGNLTRQTLLSGTGFGGTEALITQVIYADTGVVNTAYDIHGNARSVQDQINRWTYQSFDRMGRLTQLTHAGGLVETFAYDGLGQQIRRYNSHYGSGVAETTLYDRQGRIQQHIAMGGDTTTYAYTWLGAQATTGAGTFGAWQTVTTMANLKSSTVREDQFGRTVYKTDLGGNVSTFSFNAGGQLTTQAITSNIPGITNQSLGYTYFNTGKLATQTKGALENRYAYDEAGNLKAEILLAGVATLSSQTSTYDALGRMLTWNEAGSADLPASSITWQYDANGNIRRSYSTFSILNNQGQTFGAPAPRESWYRYDTMNRVVTDKGMLVGGVILRWNGDDLTYDHAGQRRTRTTSFSDSVEVANEESEGGPTRTIYFTNTRVEEYDYNLQGNLITIAVAVGSLDPLTEEGYGPFGPGVRRSSFEYDAMGRQTRQTDYAENGTTSLFDQHTYYNAKSQKQEEFSYFRRSDGVYLDRTLYFYGQTSLNQAGAFEADFSWANYALGSVRYQFTQNFKLAQTYNAPSSPTYTTIPNPTGTILGGVYMQFDYHWFDGGSQSVIRFWNHSNQSLIRTSTHYYDGAGVLNSATISDGRPRNVIYTSNVSGQTIRRTELPTSPPSATGLYEVWYRFGGKELGYTGNNGTLDTDHIASINNRMAVSTGNGMFRNGATSGSWHAAFDPSLEKVNSYNQGSSAGGYTVRAGETLGSIAANLWGDSSLWYKLAQANGLSGEAGLSEGQSLRIPAGVMKNTHNASTFKPYDPAETLGDTAPTAAKPPKKNKCGAFGQVLLVVVAAVVAYATQQYWLTAEMLSKAGVAWAATAASTTAGVTTAATLTTAGSIAVGAAAGAAASVASQAVGVAFDIQQKFSWNAVAMAAIGGGISGGMGAKFGAGSGPMQAALRGAGGNVATQGVNIAFGLQKKFDWAGVVTAGVGAGVSRAVSEGVGIQFESKGGKWIQSSGTPMDAWQAGVVGTASSLATVATRTAISGGNFGDNFRAEIPNIIGNIISTATINALRECFVAGTPVHTPKGLKPIETIQPGDLVWARDDSFGDTQVRARRVRQVFATPDRAYMRLTVALADGRKETLLVTPAHPFAVLEGGWVEAQNLPAGAAIVTRTGGTARVIRAEAAAEPETVYNFEVEEDHTYFVGGLGVWVHNDSKAQKEFEAARRKAHKEGRYAPELQLSDDEYIERGRINRQVTQSGRETNTWYYADAGRDIEAFIRAFDPDYVSSYSEVSEATRWGPRSDDFQYTAGRVRHDAEYAAALYDSLEYSAVKPPLYSLTSAAQTGLAISDGAGNSFIAALIPATPERGARVLLQQTAAAAKPSGPPSGIGRSGYADMNAFADALFEVYRAAVSDADARYRQLEVAGKFAGIKQPRSLHRGNFIDAAARFEARQFVLSEGLEEGPGKDIRINRRLYDPGGSGRYVIPDVYVAPIARLGDATTGLKTLLNNRGQVRNSLLYSGASVMEIVRSPNDGGSYFITSDGRLHNQGGPRPGVRIPVQTPILPPPPPKRR